MATFNNKDRVAYQAVNQYIYEAARLPEREEVKDFNLGLHLFAATALDQSLFVGRTSELEQIHEKLAQSPDSSEQKLLVIGGFGGIGKTQLALAYAKQFQSSYSSVFWLNATSEASLKRSFRILATSIGSLRLDQSNTDEQTLASAFLWLSEKKNTNWLLIFDNHDEPDKYNIFEYFPQVDHGSIMITSRMPEEISAKSMRLQPFSLDSDSISILETRSERSNVASDPSARRLAQRLGGFPLALATAGAFLKHKALTFKEYLDQYEAKWNVSPRRPTNLPEYAQRTLYTTWDMSFSRLQEEDPPAAKLLSFLAYLSNQSIWYELFSPKSLPKSTPSWFTSMVEDKFEFSSTIGTLVNYGFVQVQSGTSSYTLHICVHDWTLEFMNAEADFNLYWTALFCVSGAIETIQPDDWAKVNNAPLAAHATRLAHHRLRKVLDVDNLTNSQIKALLNVAHLLFNQLRLEAAEVMFSRALKSQEELLGPKHQETLRTVANLGILFSNLGRKEEAGQMLQRALGGQEQVLGFSHQETLRTVHDLGTLLAVQGYTTAAMEMYKRALDERQHLFGSDHRETLTTINNLGNLYFAQGDIIEAEKLFNQALVGQEKVLGKNHRETLRSKHNLACLYMQMGKKDEARLLFHEALEGQEKLIGRNHRETLRTVSNLTELYKSQGKVAEVERLAQWILPGQEYNPPQTQELEINLYHYDYSQQDDQEKSKKIDKTLQPAEIKLDSSLQEISQPQPQYRREIVTSVAFSGFNNTGMQIGLNQGFIAHNFGFIITGGKEDSSKDSSEES